MNTKDVFITGSFTTLTPLTYTAPNTDGLPRIGGQVYLPSSAIRGKLRRMARDSVIDETGKKLDFTDFFFLTVGGLNNAGKKKDEDAGGDDGAGKEAKESYAIPVIQAAEKFNPLISLFGAGPGSPLAIPSKLVVNHALAQSRYVNGKQVNPVSMVEPCRTDDARISPAETGELVSDEFFGEYIRQVAGQRAGSDMKKRKSELLRTLKKDGADTAAIREEIAEIEKALKEKPVSISNPALGYEVINAGETLETSMRVMRATEYELALLMRAFAGLAYNPVFGGRKAAGNGLVKGSFKIAVREHGKACAPREAGYFEWQGDYCGLSRVEGVANEWLELQLPFGELKFDYKTLATLAA